ncbi:PEP-CTERM sorting domain-containing protein [Phycisphaerales bacterium AB-hyl4]|uniref:PEP-CTERM sorting domain-containing protein n=1 Tax=Natronomicrosphaera hydrolytica TaxID=3242702 RepID=A0ABV4U4F9_9BACT
MKVKNLMLGLGVSSLLVLSGTAGAATMVDDFSSYTDGNLTGQGAAGGGWAGAWYKSGSAAISTTVNATDGNTGGGPTGGSTANIIENTRNFATPLAVTDGAPTIWLSFDIRVNFTGDSLGNSSNTVELLGAGAYGRLNDPSGNTEWSAYVLPSSPFYEFSGVDMPDNVWSTVVVKLTPTGNGIADYSMWVDPNLALTEDDVLQVAPLLDGTMSLGNTSIASLQIRSAFYDSGSAVSYDNLRVSTESSPFIPEPASLMLVGLGLLGVMSRRCRA